MSLSVGTGQALEKLQPSFVIKILSNLFIESNFFNFTTSVYGDVQLTLLSGGRLSASPSCGGRGRRGCSGLRLAGGLAGGLAWRLAGVTRERKGLVSRGGNVQLSRLQVASSSTWKIQRSFPKSPGLVSYLAAPPSPVREHRRPEGASPAPGSPWLGALETAWAGAGHSLSCFPPPSRSSSLPRQRSMAPSTSCP